MSKNRCIRSLWRIAFFCCLSFLTLFVQVGSAQEAEPMHYRNHVFITGDYVLDSTPLSGGSSHAGFAAGNVSINGVPCTVGVGPSASFANCSNQGAVPAEIVSASVYWETIESFEGQ